ncbi:MAG: AEC family transporter [Burkholderiales bacterium]
MSIITLLLPDFALIAVGFVLRRRAAFSDEFWTCLEKLVYFVLFPALLFKALAQTRIEPASAATLISGGMAAIATGMGLMLVAKHLFRLQPITLASAFQCGFRFNSYIGFAILGRLHAEAGIAAMAVMQSVMIPLVNVAAIWALARHAQGGIARELVRNPLIIATAAGVLYSVSGLPLHEIAGETLARLAQAALPLGLIAVGASIRPDNTDGAQGFIVYVTTIKLLAVPLVAWLVAEALGLDGTYRSAAIVFAALPASPTSFILAARMGGDGKLVARILAMQIMAAAFTLPLWLYVIGL